MRRKRSRFFVVLLCGSVGFAMAAPEMFLGDVFAAGDKNKRRRRAKEPKAGETLRQLYKNLRRVKNYTVSMSVLGGLSDNEDHKVTESNVNVQYDAAVFRGQFMHVPSLDAYRTPKKGVARFDGRWKNLLATPEGKRMERFLRFPQECLERALRHSRNAHWKPKEPADSTSFDGLPPLSADEDASKAEEDADDTAPGEPSAGADEGGRKGRTSVVRKSKRLEKAAAQSQDDWLANHVIRVEVPTKQALQHFVEVENSGCFGGG